MRLKLRRFICMTLAVMLIFTNAAPLVAYAIDKTAPINADGTTPHGNKNKDEMYKSVSYVGDTPIRLSVSKVKTLDSYHEGIAPKTTSAPQANTVTYKVSGRVDGSKSSLLAKYGTDGVELAYNSVGTYLGYGWLTGTKEYLEQRKAEGTDLYFDIIYNKYGVFDGYAYVTNYLDTRDDDNRYIAGATMALYDSIEIFRNPDKTGSVTDYNTDERFRGVTVVRDSSDNSVENIYIDKGFAGTESMYVLQKDDGSKITFNKEGRVVEIDKNYNIQDAINDTGNGVWTEKIVERGDTVYPDPPAGYETEGTPILYYSLSNLHCTSNDKYYSSAIANAAKIDEIYGSERLSSDLYGFDRKGNVVNVTQYDEMDFSLFVFADGDTSPVFEIVGGDYREVKYNSIEKRFVVGKDTIIYHLNDSGCRESMVDPQTGIAYIEQKTGTITEPRPNLNGDFQSYNDIPLMKTETGTQIYVWPVNVYYDTTGGGGNKTFEKILTTRIATFNADTANEYTTGTYDEAAGTFNKTFVPKLDKYGHVIYHTVSSSKYVKGEDIIDYDGDYLGYGYSDSLDRYNTDSYSVNTHSDLYNGDEDNPFNQRTHYANVTTQDVSVEIYNNHVISGNTKTPTPTREGYAFCGWLVEPSDIAAGYTSVAKAYWRVAGSTMSAEEHEKWYEAHSSEAGLGTVYTITFDANGGLFGGSGDPHSTDKILYRRLGDSYIMENVWTTGENTPNDPLDTQLVDTVENKAAGTNTVTTGTDTANDPYTSGTDGGNADMLKRVPAGTYIMEEVESPLGYKANSLPVGVTVNENTTVQTAQMADSTIKTEIVKKDAPEKDAYNYYVDGVLQKDAYDVNITKTEPKGSFSYAQVPGATLKVEGRDAATIDALSSWVQVTNNSNITKVNDSGNWCFTFSTNDPFYIEGLPAGRYRVTETVTPAGFVTMEPQNIVISDSDEIINFFGLADDHTKVEIKKWYWDDTTKKLMPNSYRANMSLVDSSDNVVATWLTDDASDYTGNVPADHSSLFSRILSWLGLLSHPQSFVDKFRELVEDDPNLSTISWDIERFAYKMADSTATVEYWLLSDGNLLECDPTTNTVITYPVPTGFAAAYAARDTSEDGFSYTITRTATKNAAKSPTLNDEIWDVSDGSQMHVSIRPKNDAGKYTADFKFNYNDSYTGTYAQVVSYDTVDGLHRFDYLPAGDYKIRENAAAPGFAIGSDIDITVQSISDIQEFTYENKKRELQITKTATTDGVGFYAGFTDGAVDLTSNVKKASVIKGAQMKLYYSSTKVTDYVNAFKNGAVPSGATLIDTFTSGDDGTYTQADYDAGAILSEQIGDLKPHLIKDVKSSGYYYLVETDTPDYYATFDTIEIEVKASMTVDELDIRPIDSAQPFNVKIFKRDGDTLTPLAGAVFEVTNESTGASLGTLVTDTSGNGSLTITSGTGKLGKDGEFIPYTFRIKEKTPAKGYRVNSEEFVFTIDPDDHDGISYIYNATDARISGGVLTVDEDETEIKITKSDFDSFDPVPGTVLKITEAEWDGSKWASNGVSDDSSWRWTSDSLPHTVYKLVAGNNYVLHEVSSPDAYSTAKDIFFKVNATGTAVEKIWYSETENPYISFTLDSEDGTVDKVTLSVKQVANIYATVTDLTTLAVTNLGSTTGNYIDISDSVITEGKSYVLKEIVLYTDGTEDLITQTSFIAHLTDNKQRLEINDKVNNLSAHITNGYGNEIYTIVPGASDTEVTIENPVRVDNNSISVVSGGSYIGSDHNPIREDSPIIYVITYEGKDKTILLEPSSKLNYSDVDVFTYDTLLGMYKYVTEDESGSIQVQTSLKTGETGYVNQKVYIDGVAYNYMNAIAVNNGTVGTIWEHTSKLLINNDVMGTHPDNPTEIFKYEVKLTKADGTPLDGAYEYVTVSGGSGTINCYGTDTEFRFSIQGDDYILICDLPYGTKYTVNQIKPAGTYFSTSIVGSESGSTSSVKVTNLLYKNLRNAKSDRKLFVKDNRYIVTNKLNFESDPSMEVSKWAFTLNDECLVDNISIINRRINSWFSKTDLTTGEELAGATCVLYDAGGSIVKDSGGNELRWVSGTTPKEFNGTLKPGKYRYHEESAPDGYGFTEDVWITIGDDGTIVNKAILADKPTEVKINKVDENGNLIAGAVLQVLKSDGVTPATAPRDSKPDALGNVLFTKDSQINFTSGTSAVDITGMLNADETYYLHEVTPPAGYKLNTTDVAFTVSHDGSLVTVTMTDEPTKAKFMKVDENGNAIAGSKLEVRNAATGDIVIPAWISTTSWIEATGVLSLGTEYELIELVSPDGYYMNVSQKFTLNADGEIEVKLADDPIKIKLIKYNADSSQKLSGGVFQILNADKSVFIDSFTINEEVTLDHNTYKFVAGKTYYFHEVTPPSGYDRSGDEPFVIPLYKAKDVIEVIMTDSKSPGPNPPPQSWKINITKLDGMTLTGLAGAEFTVYNSLGVAVGTVVTDESGKASIELDSEKYTVKETKAPEGYALNTTVYDADLTSVHTASLQVLDFAPVKILKVDSGTGKPLAGAKLQIVSDKEEVVFEGVTGADGYITFSPPYLGNYAVRELEAPEGYVLDTEAYITFEVTAGGTTGNFTFRNTAAGKGRITAWYDSDAEGKVHGWVDRNGVWHSYPRPKLGDWFPLEKVTMIFTIALAVAAAAGLALLIPRLRKSRGGGRR